MRRKGAHCIFICMCSSWPSLVKEKKEICMVILLQRIVSESIKEWRNEDEIYKKESEKQVIEDCKGKEDKNWFMKD